MSARDELAALIAGHLPGRDGFPKVQDLWLADAILAAGWVHPDSELKRSDD